MKITWLVVYFVAVSACMPAVGHAMHIMEGFLPQSHAFLWMAVVAPFIALGIRQIGATLKNYPERKLLLGLAAAFIFVLSALKIPSVTGSSSHATGVGLSAILFGPAVSSVLSGIVLVFQALLLAHGGISTWGANTFSMGVAGAFMAWGLFKVCRSMGFSEKIAVFLAAACGDWTTYMVTAAQLAWAFPDPIGGVCLSFTKFLGVFSITQIPLAISEGLLSVVVYNALLRYSEQGLIQAWWKGGMTNGK
ncbi:MAG: energy-coupling factor ABC transporter permease [Negativicutes bacterium]|jgi:cobalt/nickel transport system permease protein